MSLKSKHELTSFFMKKNYFLSSFVIFYVFFSTRLSGSRDLRCRFGELTLVGSPLIPWVTSLSYWLGLTWDKFFCPFFTQFYPSIFNRWWIQLHRFSLFTKNFPMLLSNLFDPFWFMIQVTYYFFYFFKTCLHYMNIIFNTKKTSRRVAWVHDWL